jgi:hypothetical protein
MVRDMNRGLRLGTGAAAGLLALVLLTSCGDQPRSFGPGGIGEVDVVVHVVHGTLANHQLSRRLAAEDAVHWRELIETEPESATQLQFIDGTMLSVGPEARVVLDEFVYGGPPGTDRMVLTMTKGISRFITGKMDKAAYEIRAPGAIIGVRGTDFTLVVDPEAGSTTVLVNHGEVAVRRADDGQAVILRPGEASRVLARQPAAISPPAAPPPEITQSAQRMHGLIQEARAGREAERSASREQRVGQDDRRLVALQPGDERDPISDLAERVRAADAGSLSARPASPAGAAADPTPVAATAAAPVTASPVAAAPLAAAPVAAPMVAPAPLAAAPVTAVPAPPPADPTQAVQAAPSAKDPCTGATCLTAPPPNRVTSPTQM